MTKKKALCVSDPIVKIKQVDAPVCSHTHSEWIDHCKMIKKEAPSHNIQRRKSNGINEAKS